MRFSSTVRSRYFNIMYRYMRYIICNRSYTSKVTRAESHHHHRHHHHDPRQTLHEDRWSTRCTYYILLCNYNYAIFFPVFKSLIEQASCRNFKHLFFSPVKPNSAVKGSGCAFIVTFNMYAYYIHTAWPYEELGISICIETNRGVLQQQFLAIKRLN